MVISFESANAQYLGPTVEEMTEEERDQYYEQQRLKQEIIKTQIEKEQKNIKFKAPLRQIHDDGVEPEAVVCKEELVLIVKLNGSPACVKSQTAEILEKRGWGFMPPPCCKKLHDTSDPVDESPKQIQSPKIECSGIERCLQGKVTEVIDGNTIQVNGGLVRFALTSSPEIHEKGGEAARKFTEVLCPPGSEVLVDQDDLQPLDRSRGLTGGIVLGLVYCNGVNLNEELAESKYGYIISGSCEYSEFGNSDWARNNGC